MAGTMWWNFHFCLFPGTIRSPQMPEFLGLCPAKALDGCGWSFFRRTLQELNPVEYLRGHSKEHELPNLSRLVNFIC